MKLASRPQNFRCAGRDKGALHPTGTAALRRTLTVTIIPVTFASGAAAPGSPSRLRRWASALSLRRPLLPTRARWGICATGGSAFVEGSGSSVRGYASVATLLYNRSLVVTGYFPVVRREVNRHLACRTWGIVEAEEGHDRVDGVRCLRLHPSRPAFL